MDDLEFRKSAIIDPDNQDPEFLKKAHQNQSNRQFIEKQKAFGQQIKSAFEVETPDNLSERIILNQQLSEHKQLNNQKRQTLWRNWLGGSLAASIMLAFSLSLILPNVQNDSVLAQNIITHVHTDTHALNVRMNIPKTQIDTMLASYGGKLNGPIGQVIFLGHCIIGGKTGVHMVLDTVHGVVTVMLLPTQTVSETLDLNDSQLSGILYSSQKGSIAITAQNKEAIEQTRQNIDQNLNWII
ncbi:MAG: DUF3379 domain-containing protein [Gammaproteobacteria bacterium]|nr:DUF3379 domain-containing protein [Gammaproteobacteria bacterium]